MSRLVSLADSWQDFVHEPARSALAAELSRYAREQRWYRSKAIPLEKSAIEEVFLFGEASTSDHCLVVLGVELKDGTRESYVMPLQFVATSAALVASSSLLAEVEIRGAERAAPSRGALLDASTSRVFADLLLELLCGRRVLSGERAALSGELFRRSDLPGAVLEPRFLPLEQSNSTICYGSSWLLKLLRKLEAGPNVELEMGRFLDSALPRAHVPRPVGALQIRAGDCACTLAVVSEYVENRGSAWALTLEALFTFFERVSSEGGSLTTIPLPSGSDAECTDAVPEALLRLAQPYFDWVRLLAARTAELHRALGSDTRAPGFGQEPLTLPHQYSSYEGGRRALLRVFEALRERQGSLPTQAAQLAQQVLLAEPAIVEQLRRIVHSEAAVTRIRCHGDYHLGQVLFTGDDFEGEPGRPAAERRAKCSPLRDVAGMLRSFAYAAETALRSPSLRAEDRTLLAPWAEAFRAWVCVSFVQSYLAGIEGEAYCPPSRAAARLLLEFYELEKALYEVDYELNNRPLWLPVPLAGLARIAHVRAGG